MHQTQEITAEFINSEVTIITRVRTRPIARILWANASQFIGQHFTGHPQAVAIRRLNIVGKARLRIG